MMRDPQRRRWAGMVLAGLLLGLLGGLLGPAAPASAHAVLVDSDPAANSIVAAPPTKVTLSFSESVQLIAGKIQVIGPDGNRVDQGEPAVVDRAVTVPLGSAGAQGTYLVSYRVVSADSHPVSGSITYSVGAPSTPPGDGGEAAAEPPVPAAIPVAKYLGYAGLVLLIGPALVLALLWPHRLSRRGPARVAWTGLGLIVVSTLAGLYLQAPYSLGVGVFDVGWGDLRAVVGSTFGAVMLVRLGIVIAAGVLLRPLLTGSGGESRGELVLLGVLAVAAVATWPLTGHPLASPVSGVSVVVDAIHLAAMAVWLGGLVMLMMFLLPRANERELGAILPIWARWAATAVAALVLAGVVQALIEVGSVRGLTGSTYGRLILAKVGLVAVVLAVAAYSRRLVRRRTAVAGPGRLRRAVVAELTIAALVLGVTTVLVQTAPARTAAAVQPPRQRSTTVSTTLTNSDFALEVQVFPATVGNNSIHLYAYTPDRNLLPVVEWVATAALPAQGIEPIDVALLRISDNHAVGDVSLPAPGQWTLRFTLRTSDVDQSSVSMTMNVT